MNTSPDAYLDDAGYADTNSNAVEDRPSLSIPIEPRLSSLAVGTDYACRILSPRRVQCWGGVFGSVPGGDPAMPIGRSEIDFDSDVQAVTSGTGVSCALLMNGSVFCWGSNYAGSLGSGSEDTRLTVIEPSRVVDIPTVVEIDGRFSHLCVRSVGGSVFCWGDHAGQVSDDTNRPFPVPRPVRIAGADGALQICVGTYHGCFIGRDNRVSCWGDGRQGQTGQQDLAWVSSAREVPGVSEIVSISCGPYHTCAMDRHHRIWCWGANRNLELGTMDAPYRAEPGIVPGLPVIRSMPSVGASSCAVTESGLVWCWGRNDNGQLGPAAVLGMNSANPVEVQGVGDIEDVSSGLQFVCARRRDNAVLCWGSGEFLSPAQSNQPIPNPTTVFQ